MNIPTEIIGIFIGGALTAILGVQGWMLIALVALKVQVAEVKQSLRDCQQARAITGECKK
jgi:hypothetical protein